MTYGYNECEFNVLNSPHAEHSRRLCDYMVGKYLNVNVGQNVR